MTLNQRNTEPTEKVQTEPPQRSYDVMWHVFLRAYGRLNRLSYHGLSALVKLLVVIYLLLCVVFIVLRYALLPHIDNYKTDIQNMIGASLGRSVSIGQISASWQGLRPHLELKQVELRDEHGQNALKLPVVSATVSWKSLFVADVRLYSLEINNPELELQRTASNKIYIAGWWLDPTKKADSRGLEWLLSQRTISIKSGILRWSDQYRGAPVLALSNVNFVIQNKWQNHKLSLTATPPVNLAGPIDIKADFKHHLFSENSADFSQWEGQLYADLTKTDLTAWKRYFDYPIQIEQGVGAVRAWFTFDRTKVVDFTADLKLTNVKTWLRKNLQPLDLLSVSGRISGQEISNPDRAMSSSVSFSDRLRENGHQIELTNFTFETRSGMRLPSTTLLERYIPASNKNEEQLQFSTKFLDLNILANLIEHFPIPEEYGALLKSMEPAGQLSLFSLNLQGKFPAIAHYKVAGKFANLAMLPQAARNVKKESLILPVNFMALPGFSNLSGQIDADEKKGSIHIDSTNLLLQMPDYFSQSDMNFDVFELKANWAAKKDNQWLINLSKFDFKQQELAAHFYGTYLIPFKSESTLNTKTDKIKSLGALDLTGTISHFNFQKINHYLPLVTDPDLYHWLTKGLLQGSLDDVNVRLKGDLADFPFYKKGLLDKNIFKVTGNIIDGKINYLPDVFGKDGVNPYWPILSKIRGKIEFDRQSMDIFAESGETDGISVTKVHARIPDLVTSNPLLEIEGSAKSPAQNLVHYVSVSPVLEWIGNFTEDSKMTGNANLKLRLDLPLFHPLDAKVVGNVQFKGNDIALLKEMPVFTGVTGQLDFNEGGLNLDSLKGNFLGGKVVVSGGTQKDGVIRVKAEGLITAEGVRKAYPQNEFKPLLTRISGKAAYNSVIQVKNKRTNVWVDSTLLGMAFRLPSPINKVASDMLPVHFELLTLPSAVIADSSSEVAIRPAERDEMKISLGNVVNAHYLRQKEVGSGAWKVINGGIGVNAPAPRLDVGLSAHVDLPRLNADELQALIPDKVGLTINPLNAKSAPNEFANSANKPELNKPTNRVPVQPVQSVLPEIHFSQYLEPSVLSAQVSELTLLGKKLDNVLLGASRSDGIWQANIASKQISGYLTWDNADHGLGHVKARLASLIIPETASSDVVDLLQNKNIHSSIPGLDVTADNVELFGKKLGRLELQAKNFTPPSNVNANEWQIDKLSVINPDAELTAQGKWINDGTSARTKSTKSHTELKYQLNLSNAGKLLERLGYANAISGGKGKLTGDISWAGSPYSMDIPSLSGKINLDLQSGQFLKVDPGAAKLLAVLNMQALPRRLLLDFRDVFSDGFAFDGITGDALIEKGVAHTDNLKMRSVSATVVLGGSADIAKETQNLHVVVIPEVNAGAASVVYGLAVNPVIGLGTFLAQLFLRQPLMKAFTFEYQITGSWKEPTVVKLK